MRVEGARALVTGAASGLGREAARELAGRGARVALLDRDREAGEALAAELGAASAFFALDLTDDAAVEAACGEAVEFLGGLDACLNVAGVYRAAAVVSRSGKLYPMDEFRQVIETNLVGTFNVIRHAAAAMSDGPGPHQEEQGVIVNVGSITAMEGGPGQAAYSASKAGVVGLTLPLARELGPRGIRVVAVCPGIMATPILPAGAESEIDSMIAGQPFPRRLGTPEDFALTAVQLIENEFVNGEILRLDGGLRLAA
jgi:3-hydroxyacyl-CoA dehydrogenase / 3-hydroxy-2-methylbutyryl-CoA dehydrogenase